MEKANLICSASRALLGRITPNLRAVYIIEKRKITFAKFYILTFYYDKQPTEDEFELANLADTDFLGDIGNTEFKVNTLPYPMKISDKGLCIYHRYEE